MGVYHFASRTTIRSQVLNLSNTEDQRQTAVTAYVQCTQLLLFAG